MAREDYGFFVFGEKKTFEISFYQNQDQTINQESITAINRSIKLCLPKSTNQSIKVNQSEINKTQSKNQVSSKIKN